jgi:hypothetical protein
MSTVTLYPSGPPTGVDLGEAGAVVTNYGAGSVSYSDVAEPFVAEGTIAATATATLYGTQFFRATTGAVLGIAELDASLGSLEAIRAQLLAVEGRRRDGDDLGAGYDIVLLIGQSETGAGNAIPGTDLTRYDLADPRVWQYGSAGSYTNIITAAIEPLEHLRTTGRALSPITAWAQRYLSWVAPNRRLLIVPMGYGATGFEGGDFTWKPAVVGNLATIAVQQTLGALAAAADNARVVGAAWIQGQADSGATGAANYAANIDALIAYLRAQLSLPNLPFFIGQMLPEWIDTHADAVGVDAAQIDTPRRVYRTGYSDLPRGYNYETVTPTHANAAGQRLRGSRMFDAFLRARANTSDSALAAPGAITLTQAGTTLTASWMRPLGHVTGYKVEIRDGAGAWTEVTHTTIDNTHAFAGLTLGNTYTVRVSTLNGAATSSATASSPFAMATIPGQVVGLTAPTPTGLQVDLAWTATAGATSYLVEYKLTADASWTAAPVVTTNAASIVLLLNSRSYDFRVSATNAAGTGPVSATLTLSTAALAGPFDAITPTPLWGYAVSRRLKASYAGALIRVRRSSDNTEQDIGQVNGDLDTAALLTFAGAGSAYITTIYAQIAGPPNLTQATAAKQPRIVNAGVLDTVSSRAWAQFDGVDDLMFHTSPALWAQAAAGGITVSSVLRYLGSTTKRIIGETRSGQANAYAYLLGTSGAGGVFNQANATNDAAANTIVNNAGSGNLGDALHQVTLTDTGSSLVHYRDGTSVGTFAYTRAGVYTLDRFVLGGGIRATEELQAEMGFCELCAWGSVLSAGDRALLRTNRTAYYGTP